MVILKIFLTFICGGTICAGIADIVERNNIEISDLLGIMFLLLMIALLWLI